MAEKMLQFVRLAQHQPDKRAATDRRADWAEVYRPFVAEAAAEQASRCSQCGVPFCQVHCPLNNNIPDWLKLTAEGRLEEAYELASATNNFPEICGRVCPQDRLCEGNCVIEKGFNSVTIGAVEKYITAVMGEWLGEAAQARARKGGEHRHYRRRPRRHGGRRTAARAGLSGGDL
jgi:glutamate synthase (NADPH/NADH) small chain